MRIGVISDTHGLLRPEALRELKGSDLILHAGDVGSESILAELEHIARVVAVRGNIDWEPWADRLPISEVIDTPAGYLYMLHNLEDLELDPVGAGFRALVYGHSHIPKIEQRAGVVYLNPGSAGPRRFHLPAGLARIDVVGSEIRATLIEL